MSEEFEEDSKVYVAPDDWASSDAVRGTREQEAQSLSDSVAIYLALGGKITQVPIGASTAYNPLVASVPVYGKTANMVHPQTSKDQDMSKQVNHWLTVNPEVTFFELTNLMKLRSSTLSRVINTHFATTEKGQELLKEYKSRSMRKKLEREVTTPHQDPSGNLKKVKAILEENPDMQVQTIADRIGRCYSYTYRLVIKAKGYSEEGVAAQKRAQRTAKVREVLAESPHATLHQLSTCIDATIEATKRLLREEFKEHPHCAWLVKDKRIAANREPEPDKVWVPIDRGQPA